MLLPERGVGAVDSHQLKRRTNTRGRAKAVANPTRQL